MIRDEANRTAKLARGLWPEMTSEQMLLLAEKLEGFKHDRAAAVIKTMAAERGDGFFSMPRLLEGLRADHEKHRDRRRELANERIIDFARREYGDAVRGWDDEDVLIYHFDGCRKAVVDGDAVKHGKNEAILMMKGHASLAFQEIGLEEAAVKIAVENIFSVVNA